MLKSKILFKAAFEDGQKTHKYPVLLYYTEKEGVTQSAFTVSKRKYRRAVDRNRIKRCLKEAFRVNQHITSKTYAFMFVYVGKSIEDTDKINQSIEQLLNQLENEKGD